MRWLGLLAGLGACVAVLGGSWRVLPLNDVLFLGLLCAAAQAQPIFLRPQSGGWSTISYQLGESLTVIALLRDGPAAALAVALLAAVLTIPVEKSSFVKRPFEAFEALFSFPALIWLAGSLYDAVGGHRLLTTVDSALFVSQNVIYRGYTALLIYAASLRWCGHTYAT